MRDVLDEILEEGKRGFKSSFKMFFAPFTKRFWVDAYYEVKSFLFPANVIRLRNLRKQWNETDVLMEEAIFQLLDDFFNEQQPFHLMAGVPYEKGLIPMDRHLFLLERVYGPQAAIRDLVFGGGQGHDLDRTIEMYNMYKHLLLVVLLYREGFFSKSGQDVFVEAMKNGSSLDEARKLEMEFEDLLSNVLQSVILYRGHLWT